MEEEKENSGLPWLWIILGLLIVGYIAFRVIVSRSRMLSNMEKVRQAKAEKAAMERAVKDLVNDEKYPKHDTDSEN